MSNEIVFRKAERKRSKIRVSFSGPAGSGKTYSALKMARGLTDSWDKIALIDTENGRGDLYSDLGEYNIITLKSPFHPNRFIEAIKVCEDNGMEVVIIDSISHEWEGSGGCLELNEIIAQAKFRGNTWSAWSETKPLHRKFIEAIIASPCHIITTMRSEIETVMTEDKKVKTLGMKDVQMKGFDYEMTLNFNVDRDKHQSIVSKHPIGLFEDDYSFVVSEEHGKIIKAWSESGAVECPIESQTAIFKEQLITLGMSQEKWEEATKLKWNELTIDEAGKWIKKNAFAIEKREEAKVEEKEREDTISGENIFNPGKVLKELEIKNNSGVKEISESERKFVEELDNSLKVKA
jgi:hypothetical protein